MYISMYISNFRCIYIYTSCSRIFEMNKRTLKPHRFGIDGSKHEVLQYVTPKRWTCV